MAPLRSKSTCEMAGRQGKPTLFLRELRAVVKYSNGKGKVMQLDSVQTDFIIVSRYGKLLSSVFRLYVAYSYRLQTSTRDWWMHTVMRAGNVKPLKRR